MIEWLEQWGVWAVVVSLLLSVLISIVGVIPSVILSGANVALFGLIPGFFISWAGEVIGAAVSYPLYRRGISFFKRDRKTEWKWTNQIRTMDKRKQFITILLARVTPVLPSGLVTFISVASSVPFTIYLLASSLGKVPSVAMETLITHDLFFWQDNKIRLIVSILLLAIIYLFFRKPKKHHQQE
ncbi:MAG: TVP38/TMEM64 family protein [Candidatus Pristimantibacillus sp.]